MLNVTHAPGVVVVVLALLYGCKPAVPPPTVPPQPSKPTAGEERAEPASEPRPQEAPEQPSPEEAEEELGAEGQPGLMGVQPFDRRRTTRPLTLSVIDSGQGDCALLQCPNGQNVMIDCGSTAKGNSSKEQVRSELDTLLGDQGVINVLVITHPDQDHYNWLPDVLGDRKIEKAVHSRDLDEYTVNDFNEWLPEHAEQIVSLASPYHEDEPSDLFDCGPAQIQILAANVKPNGSHANDKGWVSNSASIVLRVSYKVRGSTFTALLTGDATTYTEEALMGRYGTTGLLDVDVLRLGHHGTDVTSTTPNWLAAVTPTHAFTSSGRHGGFRHPRCVVQNRALAVASLSTCPCHQLACGKANSADGQIGTCDDKWCEHRVQSSLFDTNTNGTVTFTFDGELKVEHANGGC